MKSEEVLITSDHLILKNGKRYPIQGYVEVNHVCSGILHVEGDKGKICNIFCLPLTYEVFEFNKVFKTIQQHIEDADEYSDLEFVFLFDKYIAPLYYLVGENVYSPSDKAVYYPETFCVVDKKSSKRLKNIYEKIFNFIKHKIPVIQIKDDKVSHLIQFEHKNISFFHDTEENIVFFSIKDTKFQIKLDEDIYKVNGEDSNQSLDFWLSKIDF